jgi:hypothetical protein
MRKFIAVMALVVFSAAAVGCHGSRVISETRYDPIGLYHLLLKPEAEAPGVRYEVCWGNVFWSVILCETIVVPVILVGWYLWEPVGLDLNGYSPPPSPPRN